MLHRFIDTIRNIGSRSGFELYLANLVRDNHQGGPTVDEARREYRALMRRTTIV